jgi:hypothetical protein
MRARSFFLRILWSPAFFLAVLMVMDVLLPFSETDTAVVKDKNISGAGKGSKSYNIEAEGRIHYNESVSKSFYDQVCINDELRIKRTCLFKEWRSVELIRDGAVVEETSGLDMYYLPLLALIFLFPVLSTCPQDSVVESFWGTDTARAKTLLFSLIIEFAAVVFLIDLF